MKKGAIFDMDGLMFATETLWQKGWAELAGENGVELGEDFRREIIGTSGALMNEVIKKYFHVEDGMPLAKEERRRVENMLAQGVPEKPGIHEILAYFHEHGVKIAVASSSARDLVERNLKMTGTDVYIDEIVSGTEISRSKPAPDLFLAAARALGLNAGDCYVFEDALNGVKAGRAAGAVTIMIPDMQRPDAEMKKTVDGIYASLSEALEAIKKGEI